MCTSACARRKASERTEALARGGLLCFTVEAHRPWGDWGEGLAGTDPASSTGKSDPTDAPDPDARPQDFVLANTGRFQHSPRYVERLAAELGFAVARGEDIVPRQEAREPVDGRLYVLVKS